MSTSQFPDAVDCLASENAISRDFENRLQTILTKLLPDILSENIRPEVELDLTKVPDMADVAVFLPALSPAISTVRLETAEDGTAYRYNCELTLTVILCGPQARAIGTLFRDAMQVEQNEELFKPLGLGFIDSELRFSLAQRAKVYTERCDVALRFNYQYLRKWAVFPLVDAPFSVTH